MLKGLIYLVIVIGVFFAYVKYIESRSIFFPSKTLDATPQIVNLDFEDVRLKTSDAVDIHGWFIPQGGKKAVLFFHGNGGNISHRLEKILLLRSAGIDIFIIDYRGYGKSEGRPTEKGVYLDAQAAYDYLVSKKGLAPKDIIVYGESLGCAVAIDLVSKNEVGALILEGSFSSGRDMAKILYPYLPVSLFFTKFNSETKIKKINVPVMFIHSPSDEIVPIKLAQKLFDAANEPKKFIKIRGGHNTAFIDSQDAYTQSIKSFIESVE